MYQLARFIAPSVKLSYIYAMQVFLLFLLAL